MFQLSLTDRLAQIDCRRTGQAEGYYRCKLSRDLSHRICRHGRASQMPQNRRIGGSPHSPHDFSLVICKPDRKVIYSDCQWSGIQETGTLGDMVLEKVTIVAGKRLETEV